MRTRVLAIFPSIYLYGKERSNIEVFSILKSDPSFQLRILSNIKAKSNLKERLECFDTSYVKFPDRSRIRFRLLRYLIDFIRINLYFCLTYIKYKPSIVYINNEMSIYDLYPMLRIMPSSIIYRIGDIPAYPSLSGYKFNSHMWKEIVVKRVSKMVFVSKFIMNEIEKTGRNCDEDIVIYNLPPSRELATNNDWMSDIRNCQLRLGYIGQIRELKGVHILIDSIIKAKQSGFDVSCVLAGDTNLFKEYSDDLISKVERNKLSQKIKFIGEIDNIDAFFKNIDVLCIPTIWPEALGNVLVESKLYKTPAIIFPSGGMPELVSHKIDGFICNDKTAEALIEGFKYYLNNKSRISIEGLNAYNSLANLDITSGLFKQKWLMAFNSVTEKI